MLESVDVDCYGCSSEPQDWAKRGIGAVTDQRCIVTLRNCVNRGKKRVNDSVELLVPDRGQDLEPDAVILQLPW